MEKSNFIIQLTEVFLIFSFLLLLHCVNNITKRLHSFLNYITSQTILR